MSAIIATAHAVAQARTAAGLTQRELARRAGTAQSVVARIERGQANPTVETLERLLNAAGFDLQVQAVPRPMADPVVSAYARDVDRTLLRQNLARSVNERLAMNEEILAATNAIRGAVHRPPPDRSRGRGAPPPRPRT